MLSVGYIACIFLTYLNPTSICVPHASSSNKAAFLGAFAEILKATISFIMSVRQSSRSGPPIGQIFVKYDF